MLNKLFPLLFILTVTLFISGCEEKKQSSPATLYKYSADKGNGVVSLIVWDDPNGERALSLCEKLKKILEKEDNLSYSCSKLKDNDFIPNIKWK